MDWYTKAILTVIAIALIVLSVRVGEFRTAQAGLFDDGPTVGDFKKLREIRDPDERERNAISLIDRIPMVKLYGTVQTK